MKRLILLTILLAACKSTRTAMDEGLKPMLGQDVSRAVAKLGYPDSTLDMNDTKVYVWKLHHNVADIGDMVCKIQMGVNSAGVVQHIHWEGNTLECRHYLARLSE